MRAQRTEKVRVALDEDSTPAETRLENPRVRLEQAIDTANLEESAAAQRVYGRALVSASRSWMERLILLHYSRSRSSRSAW